MKLINADIKTAITIVWIIISIVVVCIILSSIFLNADYFKSIPTCEAKLNNATCSFCGMTSAFIQIGLLNFKQATYLNSGSILLYVTMLINSLFFFAYLSVKFINHLKLKNKTL